MAGRVDKHLLQARPGCIMASSAYSRSARRTISRHIRKHKKEGMPQKQAVAAAMSEARRKGKKVPAKTKAAARKR